MDEVFFFQAEDGIRDLVRSRGLGDVYKRQDTVSAQTPQLGMKRAILFITPQMDDATLAAGLEPVSYTHLTLPTSDLV